MADTSIEWTDKVWNPLRGCSVTSPGCHHCFAAEFAARFSGPGQPFEGLAYFDAKGRARWTGDVRPVPQKLPEPLHWKKPRKVFVNSMSDLFHEDVPESFIAAAYGVMGLAHWHTFQVLTKRAGRAADVLSRMTVDRVMGGICEWFPESIDAGGAWSWPLPNVWLGVSVENREHGLPRIDALRRTPAAVRFLSVEPLLEDLGTLDLTGIGWVIVGGESGRDARPMHPDWVRAIRDRCIQAGIAFHFKQWGEIAPEAQVPGLFVRPIPDRLVGKISWPFRAGQDFGPSMVRLGKAKSGRMLDGVTHDAMPTEVARVY